MPRDLIAGDFAGRTLGRSDKGTIELSISQGADGFQFCLFLFQPRPEATGTLKINDMTAELASPVQITAAASLAGEYLTFTLKAESYSIEVLKEREIKCVTPAELSAPRSIQAQHW